MHFDFTPFSDRPPPGFTVLQADKECLRLSRKSLKDKSIHVFTITKTEPGTFSLYHKNMNHTGDVFGDGDFILKSDLGRVLALLGYGTKAAPLR